MVQRWLKRSISGLNHPHTLRINKGIGNGNGLNGKVFFHRNIKKRTSKWKDAASIGSSSFWEKNKAFLLINIFKQLICSINNCITASIDIKGALICGEPTHNWPFGNFLFGNKSPWHKG